MGVCNPEDVVWHLARVGDRLVGGRGLVVKCDTAAQRFLLLVAKEVLPSSPLFPPKSETTLVWLARRHVRSALSLGGFPIVSCDVKIPLSEVLKAFEASPPTVFNAMSEGEFQSVDEEPDGVKGEVAELQKMMQGLMISVAESHSTRAPISTDASGSKSSLGNLRGHVGLWDEIEQEDSGKRQTRFEDVPEDGESSSGDSVFVKTSRRVQAGATGGQEPSKRGYAPASVQSQPPSSSFGSTGPGPTSQDLGAQVQLGMLKVLEKMQKKSGNGSSSDEELGHDGEKNGSGREFAGIRRLRTKFRDHPRRFSVGYVRIVRERLGVTHPKQYFHLRDYSRKIQASFGKLRGLWRVHYHLSEAFQLGIDAEHLHVLAMITQMLKSLHQCALDDGDWGSAALIIPTENPSGRPEFGGDEHELEQIVSYRKSMRELKLSLSGKTVPGNVKAGELEPDVVADGGDGEDPPDKAKPKGKAKPKK